MAATGIPRVEQRLKTPRAAATAGIIFSVLFGTSIILSRLVFPSSSLAAVTLLERQVGYLSWATGLAPFAGIAFLWFLGVIRDRLGVLEDQFFSTVFFGSGLLFVAMMISLYILLLISISMIQQLVLPFWTIVDHDRRLPFRYANWAGKLPRAMTRLENC